MAALAGAAASSAGTTGEGSTPGSLPCLVGRARSFAGCWAEERGSPLATGWRLCSVPAKRASLSTGQLTTRCRRPCGPASPQEKATEETSKMEVTIFVYSNLRNDTLLTFVIFQSLELSHWVQLTPKAVTT